MENYYLAIILFALVGIAFSYFAFNFVFIKLYEKTEKRRMAICSISSGYIILSFILLFTKNITIKTDKTQQLQVDIILYVANFCRQIDSSILIFIIIICFCAILYEFFYNSINKNNLENNKIRLEPNDSKDATEIKITRNKEFKSYDSDLIPHVDVWVGRNQELELLESINRGVAVITGFGGQGKSALAAKCVRDLMKIDNNLFWDWRDCKEESDRFRTQLVSVISNFTEGEYKVDTFSDASIVDISKAFFKLIGDRLGVIVFDNVDHYVNIDENLFTSDVSCFVNEALRVDHHFLILFTCRPRVSYPSPTFREIYLRGFSLEESKMLFHKKVPGGLRKDLEEKVAKFHEFSEGHPLWLDIIASQVSRKLESADEILREMEAGQMDERAKSMLRSVWKSLSEDQKNILRCMTEVQRSVGEEKIYDFVEGEIINHNRFSKAFKGLKAINLIIERTNVTSSARKFDLHPIVRGFIRDEYHNSAERKRYISMVLRHYDHVLIISRKDTKSLSVAVLEELDTKIELEIENGDIDSAIDTIDYTSDDFVERGLHEEYIRLAKKVFKLTDWNTSLWKDNDKFHNLCSFLIKTMTEVGNYHEASSYLEIYTKNTTSGTSRYISICDLNCYVNWFVKNYDKAILWGRRGADLKKKSGVDTKFDTSHNLALSLRDNGQVDEALKIFTHGLSIDEVLRDNHKTSNRGAAFYGNIGRCLALKKQHVNALKLYSKSYDLLESDSGSVSLLNKGYASYWIAEVLYDIGKFEESCRFALRAYKIWEIRAPLLSRLPEHILENIKKNGNSSITNESDSELEIFCRERVTNFI